MVGAEAQSEKKGVAATAVRMDVHPQKGPDATGANVNHACAALTITAAAQPGIKRASMNARKTALDVEITGKVVAGPVRPLDVHRPMVLDVTDVPVKAVSAPWMTIAVQHSGMTSA